MSEAPSTLGLFGFGAFGRLAGEHLVHHADVLVHDPNADAGAVRALGATPARLPEAAACDAVLLAVPVQTLREVLESIAPHVREGSLVADVCSVKTEPIRLMLDALPPHAQVLGTHPLFGPQTASEAGSVVGQTVALCPARMDPAWLAHVRELLTSLGLNVIETDADEHDRQMAWVQVLTHLVGHAAGEMDLPDLPLATVAYTRLMQLRRNIAGDTEELFAAIQTHNPHAAAMRQRFFEAMKGVIERADRMG